MKFYWLVFLCTGSLSTFSMEPSPERDLIYWQNEVLDWQKKLLVAHLNEVRNKLVGYSDLEEKIDGQAIIEELEELIREDILDPRNAHLGYKGKHLKLKIWLNFISKFSKPTSPVADDLKKRWLQEISMHVTEHRLITGQNKEDVSKEQSAYFTKKNIFSFFAGVGAGALLFYFATKDQSSKDNDQQDDSMSNK